MLASAVTSSTCDGKLFHSVFQVPLQAVPPASGTGRSRSYSTHVQKRIHLQCPVPSRLVV